MTVNDTQDLNDFERGLAAPAPTGGLTQAEYEQEMLEQHGLSAAWMPAFDAFLRRLTTPHQDAAHAPEE